MKRLISVKDNFRKRADVNAQGTEYDYASVMHYGTKAFSLETKILDKNNKKILYLFFYNKDFYIFFSEGMTETQSLQNDACPQESP